LHYLPAVKFVVAFTAAETAIPAIRLEFFTAVPADAAVKGLSVNMIPVGIPPFNPASIRAELLLFSVGCLGYRSSAL